MEIGLSGSLQPETSQKQTVRMKKYLKYGLFVIAVLIIIIIWNRNKPAPERIRSMLLDNKDAYDAVARLYYNDYQTHHAGMLSYSGGNSSRISCDMYHHEIVLTDEECLNMQKVAASYYLDEQFWERVYVYDTFVAFCNINGRESLVYSVEDKRPTYINRPDDKDKHVTVRKITDHWYYAYDSYIGF